MNEDSYDDVLRRDYTVRFHFAKGDRVKHIADPNTNGVVTLLGPERVSVKWNSGITEQCPPHELVKEGR